jgi:hypothetical protein
VRTWVGRWWHVVEDHDTEPIQLSLIVLLLAWGALFLAPGSGFATSGSMALLARYTSDDVWACGAIVLAITWAYGFFGHHRRVVRWCAFISAIFWAILMTSALLSSTGTFAWIAYLTFAGQSGWVFLRGGGQWTQP